MDHPNFIVANEMEEAICQERAKHILQRELLIFTTFFFLILYFYCQVLSPSDPTVDD